MRSPFTQSQRTGYYATAFAFMLALIFNATPPAHAQTETALYSFANHADGGAPNGALVRDAEGNLYGTASGGGSFKACTYGCGVVFKVAPDGTETVLHTFTGGADGSTPVAGLLRDANGNLYGTTAFGGSVRPRCQRGCGVVFKLSPEGTETVLHTFADGTDGAFPESALIADAQGNLYGTAQSDPPTTLHPCGLVFKLTPGNSLTTFGVCNVQDLSGLVQDSLGNLYGTSAVGGSFGLGTVFEVTSGGQSSILYSFAGGANDGTTPIASLLLDQQGNLFGPTFSGGPYSAGTIFELNSQQQEKVIYNFDVSDGFYPHGGLIGGSQGNLYGTTENGGGYGSGEVFQLSPSGEETILYSFTGSVDGGVPQGTLLGDNLGNLYGVTIFGGTFNKGVVFKISR